MCTHPLHLTSEFFPQLSRSSDIMLWISLVTCAPHRRAMHLRVPLKVADVNASTSMCTSYVGLAKIIYIRYCWQGNHQIYGQIRCICTVLASLLICHMPYSQGWPGLYVYTVYMHLTFGDYQAKNTVCTSCIYGSGQPYLLMSLFIYRSFIVLLTSWCAQLPLSKLVHTKRALSNIMINRYQEPVSC
jgi:hypothetical protein